MQECQRLQINNVNIEDIYLGNGVSELITIAMQALLNDSDEVLIPAPDYPLWTAAVSLSGGKPIHYLCDEQADWYPSITDIESKLQAALGPWLSLTRTTQRALSTAEKFC